MLLGVLKVLNDKARGKVPFAALWALTALVKHRRI